MYHGMVERQTGAVTVFSADGMHLDITPSELLDEHDPRRSRHCHAKPEEPIGTHCWPITEDRPLGVFRLVQCSHAVQSRTRCAVRHIVS